MSKKKTLKKNIQEILNEKDQVETHNELKQSLRKAGINVVNTPKINVNKEIKKHINELMDGAVLKRKMLSQKNVNR